MELGLGAPAHRLDLRTADPETLRAPHRCRVRAARPTPCSSTATRTRRSPARRPASQQRPRSACRGGAAQRRPRRCPRSGTGSRSTGISALLFAPDERSAATLEPKARRGEIRRRRRRDGRRDAQLRAARARTLGDSRSARGRARRLRRRHRPPRGERRPERLAPDRRRLGRARASQVIFPAHPRTRGRARGQGSCSAHVR